MPTGPIRKTYKAAAREYILEYIHSNEMRPGDRLPPQRELARRLNISPKIAELALGELAEAGLLVRHPGSGTFLAEQELAKHPVPVRGDKIFLLVQNLRNPQSIEFISELERLLAEQQRYLRILTPHAFRTTRELLNVIASEETGGIVSLTTIKTLTQFAARYGIEHVSLRIGPPAPREKQVSDILLLDVGKQAELLADYLWKSGYRNFLLAGGMPELEWRFQVLSREIEKRGGCYVHLPEPPSSPENLDYELIGKNLGDAIAERIGPKSVAVFYNSARALGAMRRFQHLGVRIPEQLGMAAFDNIHLAHLFEPELTMTDAGYLEAAQKTVELLLTPAGVSPRTVVIEPTLSVGRSTLNISEDGK